MRSRRVSDDRGGVRRGGLNDRDREAAGDARNVLGRHHAWSTITATVLLDEESCASCGIRRWRRPDGNWVFGRGDGPWVEEPIPPECRRELADQEGERK